MQHETNSELFHVQVAPGDVRVWTLDQLDAAFNADVIDERTYVMPAGSSKWATLAEVAGLDDGAAAQEEQPPPSVAPPPVVADVGALDIDEELALFAPKKKGRAGRVVATMLLLSIVGAGAFVATKRPDLIAKVTRPAVVQANVAAVASPPPAAPALPALPPAAQAIAASLGPATVSVDALPRVLTEDQKKALAAADKAQVEAQKKKHQEKAAKAERKRQKNSPFHKGGNAADPLNSAL